MKKIKQQKLICLLAFLAFSLPGFSQIMGGTFEDTTNKKWIKTGNAKVTGQDPINGDSSGTLTPTTGSPDKAESTLSQSFNCGPYIPTMNCYVKFTYRFLTLDTSNKLYVYMRSSFGTDSTQLTTTTGLVPNQNKTVQISYLVCRNPMVLTFKFKWGGNPGQVECKIDDVEAVCDTILGGFPGLPLLAVNYSAEQGVCPDDMGAWVSIQPFPGDNIPPINIVSIINSSPPIITPVPNGGEGVGIQLQGVLFDPSIAGEIHYTYPANGHIIHAVTYIGPFGSCVYIPTLSEWSLIILLLLFAALAMRFIYQRQTSLAIQVNLGEENSIEIQLWDRKLFLQHLAITLSLTLLVLMITFWLSSTLTLTDTIGSIACAAIIAYMTHLFHLKQRYPLL